jgi:hypothetical protein
MSIIVLGAAYSSWFILPSHTRTHARTHACTYTHMHTCMHTRVHTRMHMYVHTRETVMSYSTAANTAMLKMEATIPSVTLLSTYQTTKHHIQKDHIGLCHGSVAQVQSQASQREICNGLTGTGIGFCRRNFYFPFSIILLCSTSFLCH